MKQLLAILTLIVLAVVLIAQTKAARVATITPGSGKPGIEYVAAGENLAKDTVKDLYMTNGKEDIKVEIVSQKDDAIQFKPPANTKPGRYSLMTLTADGKQFVEQPVKMTIE